jgi:hypothetical protein
LFGKDVTIHLLWISTTERFFGFAVDINEFEIGWFKAAAFKHHEGLIEFFLSLLHLLPSEK